VPSSSIDRAKEVREQEINKVPKFCTAIFSSVEAKNTDIPIGMASIFNEK